MYIQKLKKYYLEKYKEKKIKFNRSLSFGDYFTDRWKRAKREGFGEGSSVYDNVLILGNVKVGKYTWIGPNCILDGSGGLEIGDYCSISAGVQIYSHQSIKHTISLGKEKIERKSTKIGNGVYIAPNSIIQMGITIGDSSVIGTMSFVNKNVKAKTRVFGCPAKELSKK